MTPELGRYVVAFLMTIVLEVVVALACGYRGRRTIACVVWVNVFSHPLANYLVWVVDSLRGVPVGTSGILLFEAGVVVLEWRFLCYALPAQSRARLFLLSLAMNIVSYSIGNVVPWG